MQRPDAIGPTAPSHPPIPIPPPPSSSATMFATRRNMAIAIAAALALFLLMTGILIGRATKRGGSTTVVANDKLAQLAVSSKPVDANVLVDGRFVGVSPVDRIDLDAGKHSVVIDAFGYQPYAGTLEVEESARASLKVVLAPIGDGSGSSHTSGELVGRGGKATTTTIPATALAPVSLTGTGASKDAKPKKKPSGGGGYSSSSSSSYSPAPPPAPAYEPPPRPRRDCSGEKSRCRDGCYNANNSCRFNCPNCISCSSSVGSEMCKQQCETCRSGCEQNTKFCESSCDTNYNSCEASNQ